MNKITIKYSALIKWVEEIIKEKSYEETLEIKVIHIVDDKTGKEIGKIYINKNPNDNEQENTLRRSWRRGFLCLGGILLIYWATFYPNFLNKIGNHLMEISWCFSWASFGIWAGLYNSRFVNDKRSKERRHYFEYFIFVWFIASFAAFVALGSFPESHFRSYVAALLTGIVVGFAGDKLGEKLDLAR